MQLQGVIHVHSTHSYDGKLSLAELKTLFQSQGLQFACMTEHTDYLSHEFAQAFVEECAALSDESFVFVPGFEVPYKDSHILHIGTTDFIAPTADAVQLHAWRAATPLVILAHPVRNKFIVDETVAAVIDGVEVWNQQYDGKATPRAASVRLLESLRADKKLLATGGLDLHREEHFGSPQVQLEAAALNVASIVDALKAGAFTFGTQQHQYRATGPITLSVAARATSRLVTGVIRIGKGINATLARVGLRLPRALTRLVRGKL